MKYRISSDFICKLSSLVCNGTVALVVTTAIHMNLRSHCAETILGARHIMVATFCSTVERKLMLTLKVDWLNLDGQWFIGQWFIVSYDSANKQKHHKSHRMQ